MKSRGGKSQRREENKKEDQRRERVKKKEDQRRERVRRKKMQARKGRKVANHCVFPMICRSGGSKSRLAKAAGGEPSGQMRDEKLHAVVARSTFRSQNAPNTSMLDHFWKLRCWKSARTCGAKRISKSTCHKHHLFAPLLHVKASLCVAGAKEFCTLSEVRKTWGSCSISKIDGRHGTFEEDLQGGISCGRCSTIDMFIRDVRRSGRWFPEKGCVLEHQIFRFAKMILRDRRSCDLASLFPGRRSNLDRWSGNTAKCDGTRPSALHTTFHFEGSLSELLRFSCCQLRKLRTSRRIASFSKLQIER